MKLVLVLEVHMFHMQVIGLSDFIILMIMLIQRKTSIWVYISSQNSEAKTPTGGLWKNIEDNAMFIADCGEVENNTDLIIDVTSCPFILKK
jgi:hypothetical protein